MEKTRILLISTLAFVSALAIGLYVGAYFGIKYHMCKTVNPAFEMSAMHESYELLNLSIYLKEIKNGNVQNVMEVMYSNITGNLDSVQTVYSSILSDKGKQQIDNHRKQIISNLESYKKTE
jgi:hypothetical protein